MTYLTIALTVIWLLGIVVFAARFLNFTRLLYNNFDPVKDLSKTGIFSSEALFYPAGAQSIDPANLTEAGKQYQKQAVRDEQLALVWGLGGLMILVCVFAPFENGIAIAVLVAILAGFYFWARRIRLGRATRIEGALANGLDALTFFLR